MAGGTTINSITDIISNQGLEYAADYTESYTERSLVDKIYVDGQFANATINNDNFLLPIAHQVAARTIGLDLVPVQPLDIPNADIMYINVDIWNIVDYSKEYTPDEFFNDATFDDYFK